MKILIRCSIIFISLFLSTSFVLISENDDKKLCSTSSIVGKAWWYSYYVKNEKIAYITKVYNNDCDHCSNRISTAFAKWLTMNDIDNQPSTPHITSLHDVTESSLEKRREDKILWFKQRGYSIVNINFTYDEE